MWLDAADVVDETLADIAKGKTLTIPNWRYKAMITAARLGGRRLTRRFGTSGGPRVAR